MEAFERGCSDNMRRKIEEVEFVLRDNHKNEINSVIEKFRRDYIEIREHEMIMQQQMDKDHETNLKLMSDFRETFQFDQEQLRNINIQLENKLEWMSTDYCKALDNKERVIQEL
jgi:hypothetical protein